MPQAPSRSCKTRTMSVARAPRSPIPAAAGRAKRHDAVAGAAADALLQYCAPACTAGGSAWRVAAARIEHSACCSLTLQQSPATAGRRQCFAAAACSAAGALQSPEFEHVVRRSRSTLAPHSRRWAMAALSGYSMCRPEHVTNVAHTQVRVEHVTCRLRSTLALPFHSWDRAVQHCSSMFRRSAQRARRVLPALCSRASPPQLPLGGDWETRHQRVAISQIRLALPSCRWDSTMQHHLVPAVSICSTGSARARSPMQHDTASINSAAAADCAQRCWTTSPLGPHCRGPLCGPLRHAPATPRLRRGTRPGAREGPRRHRGPPRP
jgi:hypothetical protein